MTMIFVLIYILLAGLLIKSFYTHYISERRKYFSFDDRRFTDDDYLKVQDLNIEKLERIFLFFMLFLFLLALGVHLFVDPVLSIWLIALFVSSMLTLSLIVDIRLYTISYDRSHLVMSVIWGAIIAAIFIFLYMRGMSDVDMTFETDRAVMMPADISYEYAEIDAVELVSSLPEIPFNHNVLGTIGQRHGSFTEGEDFYSLNVEDQSADILLIEIEGVQIYLNDADEAVTNEWHETLKERTE